jgi:hypothetical protein
MNAEYYDLNVWGSDSGVLYLTAYEWELAPDGEIQMNTEKYWSIDFKAPEDIKEIEFLLGDLYINQFPLTDLDEWRDLDTLYNDKTPKRIKDFLEILPMYDVPIVGSIDG